MISSQNLAKHLTTPSIERNPPVPKLNPNRPHNIMRVPLYLRGTQKPTAANARVFCTEPTLAAAQETLRVLNEFSTMGLVRDPVHHFIEGTQFEMTYLD
jgi:hypothetical protein